MSSRAPTKHRRYTNRGVQTDLVVEHCCQTSVSKNEAAGVSLQKQPIYFKSEQQATNRLSSDEFPVSRSAYSHCQQSNSTSTAQSQGRKQASFPYSQPSSRSSGVRVVSLPEICSTHSGAGVDIRNRVVSLPEHGCYAVSSSDLDDSGSIELGNLSGNSILLSRRDAGSRPYPLDLPRTPSPPSSPDSIMIINHEANLPGSFLRHPYTDADGWITWASSPPRPIPALHGPLSLPYARCPSGAEGTLIEGDDLSNKIWGLGSDDIYLNSRQPGSIHSDSRNISNADVEKQVPPGIRPADARRLPQQRQRDAVIDISGPPAYVYARPETQITHQRQKQGPLGLSSTRPHTIRDGRPPDISQNENMQALNLSMTSDQRRNTQTAVDFSHTSVWPRYSGLGFQWYGQQAVDPRPNSCNILDESTGHHLRSSARPFVPASASVDNLVIRADNPGRTIVQAVGVPPPPGALDITQQYQERQRRVESWTPSTTSTHWSPKFPYLVAGADLGQDQPHISSSPIIYSPPLDVEDYPTALQTIIQQLQARDTLGPEPFKSRNTNIDVAYAPTFLQLDPQKNVEKIHLAPMEHQALPYPRSPVGPSLQLRADSYATTTQHNLSVVPDGRRNLSDKTPRSIPLARLIQRRLSSVAEEDVIRAKKQEPPKYPLLGYPKKEQSISEISQGHHFQGADDHLRCSSSAYDSMDEKHTTKTSNEIFDLKVVVKLPGKFEKDPLRQDTNLKHSLNVDAPHEGTNEGEREQ